MTKVIKISEEVKNNLDLPKLHKAVKLSLEMSLEKLTLTLQDHRYHQGVVMVLKDLDNILTDSIS